MAPKNNPQDDQLWHDLTFDSKLGGRSNFEISFLGKIRHLDWYQQEKHDGVKFFALWRSEGIEEKRKVLKIVSVWPQ